MLYKVKQIKMDLALNNALLISIK